MAESLAPADRPARRPLLWLGAVLWAAVFVALVAAFFLRGDRSAPPEPGTELVAADGGEAGARLLPGGVEPPTEPVYDPEGLPAFSLTERRGETVTNETLEGSPWIAGFVFTRCATVCPRVTKAMADLRKPLEGSGVKLVSFTVDPDYDTPEILTNYSDFYDAKDDKDWLFLTGDRGEIYTLIGDGFKQPVGYEDGHVDPNQAIFHTNNLMLVGPDGVVRGKYNSQDPTDLIKLRRDALELAGEGDEPASGENADEAAAAGAGAGE
ncbi:SCO family protein [Alienimonas sp. DA493]|uniref:SCO family protein n=1 Tax=Alienimonas sp. DA493 TaxID=3373605 RepID=UPI003754024B